MFRLLVVFLCLIFSVKSIQTTESSGIILNKNEPQNFNNDHLQSKNPLKGSSSLPSHDSTNSVNIESKMRSILNEAANGTTTTDNHIVKEMWGTSAVTGKKLAHL